MPCSLVVITVISVLFCYKGLSLVLEYWEVVAGLAGAGLCAVYALLDLTFVTERVIGQCWT